MIFNVLIFLFVLGLLVFFHEMGHFLAAKACGVYVDRFSLGMPPRVWGFRWGQTDYCIGAMPFGGYVKMAGQEDSPRSDEEQQADYAHVPPEQWFNKKPVWQRYIIILAGPFMNIVLAFLLYIIVAGVGAEIPRWKIDNRIGEVAPGSAAADAPLYRLEDGATPNLSGEPDARGWQTADRIVSIDGEEIRNVAVDVAMAAVLGGDAQRQVVIERTNPLDGTTERYLSPVTPKLDEETERLRFGVSRFDAALVDSVLPGEPAEQAGIQPGDVIVAANGQPIDAGTFSKLAQSVPEGEAISVTVRRADGSLHTLDVPAGRRGQFLDFITATPTRAFAYVDGTGATRPALRGPADFLRSLSLSPEAPVARIGAAEATWDQVRALFDRPLSENVAITVEGAAEKSMTVKDALKAITGYDPDAVPAIAAVLNNESKFKRNDRIIAIDGQPATVASLAAVEDAKRGETVTLTIQRPAVGGGVLRRAEEFEVPVTVADTGFIGVVFGQDMVFHRYPPNELLGEAWYRSKQDIGRVIDTLGQLVTGGLSAKELGGPVMIFQVTTAHARMGYSWLLEIMAFISINLAIFNLLPLPVLDGGQCVLLGIEGIRRKPLDVMIVERIQYAGLIFIIFLMLFVTFNDVQRLVQGLLN